MSLMRNAIIKPTVKLISNEALSLANLAVCHGVFPHGWFTPCTGGRNCTMFSLDWRFAVEMSSIRESPVEAGMTA